MNATEGHHVEQKGTKEQSKECNHAKDGSGGNFFSTFKTSCGGGNDVAHISRGSGAR